MEINATKKVKVNAKTLHLHLKVRDQFGCSITDQFGHELTNQDDIYVPSFMPGDHYGDYVILDIDLDSGQILNWPKIKAKDIEDFIAEGNQEEEED